MSLQGRRQAWLPPDRRLLVLDPVLELVLEVLQSTPHDGPRGGVPEGAEAAAVHHPLAAQVHADALHQVDVFAAALALQDAEDHLVEEVRPDPAGDTLPAALV